MAYKKWLFAAAVLLIAGGGITAFFLTSKPELTGTASSASSKMVFPDHTWTFYFTEKMNSDSINQDTVFIEDSEGNKVEVSLTLINENRSLRVAPPEEGYTVGETYTMSFSDELKSSLGLKLKESSFTFTIVDDLPSFQSEEEVKNYFAAAMEKQRVFMESDMMVEESSAESSNSSADMASSGGEGSGGYSETNNQVEGVNEADIVKTDGSYIYHLNQNQDLLIHRILESGETERIQVLSFEQANFYGNQLFLHENTLVVLGDAWSEVAKNGLPAHSGVTSAYIYDVSDPANPQLQREVAAQGHMMNARMIGDNLYFITGHYPDVWLMQEEPEKVEVLPFFKDSTVSEEYQKTAAESIKVFPESEEINYSTITSVNVADLTLPAKTQSYLGGSGELYMSQSHLYMAAYSYDIPENTEASDTADTSMDIMPAGRFNANTKIYKFAINDLDVQFVAEGTVRGTILNQFSMDEHEGYFRIVTTDGSTFGENRDSTNNLFILDEGMNITGSVEDLAIGERIYSARFMGDKAYMVTFRETDPLFVIDTADPANPEVLGELKIPGFSNYLHPLDENHLIGFGNETSLSATKPGEPPLVLQEGMKISLFDVTDFSNPVEKDVEVIGGRGTYSPIMHDHKALFQHKERNLYGFPINLYNQEDLNSEMEFVGQGAMVYKITTDGIELAEEYIQEKEPNQMYEEYESMVQRMIYVDDTLYTISMKGINHYPLPE
ncbi:beta-propeller domain-containing protein [Jeotgalibacillus aurantiacus]|uniref:beta-propeller domain-containing protein n=1 Tax=Jeotgalibacillus aurantiacus TaxID=2763266 RepID=UPI001D0BE451|nr:beta-propeller domain-containing protein [Jeotgalibacillus aurantiacus]